MAIKPIERFGKFTPPRPDQSGEIRMRALAGLGKDISSLGRSYAQVKASERREEEKEQRIQQWKRQRGKFTAPQNITQAPASFAFAKKPPA